ncbi:rubrerythrin family protein [Anaeromicropila herbilytica]|uniref:Rubrerythrin n=1 Tax=Anaeromicropila herbilytica TaxID=2785025 RepID=A0A7R7ICL6_9FIRM|nr:ferritin family protein [Anaeromicropila herbilytica]BCN30652.1 rubrerythrin [Anaeromicropila herbilytica]
MNFQDSETYKNLLKALEGEMKASTKYRIYGNKAREDGYEQIADIFNETSGNEQEHAEIWMKVLDGGELQDTYENLKDAMAGEHYEWTQMYKKFAEIAMREGYTEISKLFASVGNIEKHHDYRYERLANNIKTDTVFCKPQKTIWICMKCGNLIYDECAPEECPVCGHLQGYYKMNCENY